MFSARTSWDRTENRLSLAVRAHKSSGRPLIDLTESNPTGAGIVDTAPLVELLGRPRAVRYEPLPFGHPTARAAVAEHYVRRGRNVRAEQVVLTASTSEAYGWLFTVLADAGDRVLVPRPSYPLLGWLAATHEVVLEPYALDEDARFGIDASEVERAAGDGARAIVVVHPNNPTGTFVRTDEATRLVDVAARRGLALVVDEVFADHRLGEAPPDLYPTFAGTSEALTFVLSGLSKIALLPQVKLGWIIVSGPSALVNEAMARLELVADTYLSVGTPVQLALPDILARTPEVEEAVKRRLEANLRALDRAILGLGPSAPVRRMPVSGGFYVVLEIPRLYDEERWALELLEKDGVLVQPGYFFDFRRQGVIVLSLLPEEQVFAEGIGRIVRRIAAECAG
jgi:alanine-synthesizing transaminase